MGFRLSKRLMLCVVTWLAVAMFGQVRIVSAGPAIGQFELKDLEAEVGTMEFQSQNAHSWGQPSRRNASGDDPNDLLFDDNSVVRQRHALELEATLTHFFRMRVGIEYEKERVEARGSLAEADTFGALKLDEVAVEGVVIFVPVKNRQGIGFGVLAEFEYPLEKGELNTIVFGPIVEMQSGRWSALANLALVHFFGRGEVTEEGLERDNKWDFAYASQVMYEVTPNWSVALEAYGTVDRLGDSGQLSDERAAFGDHDQHRLGPLVYYRFNAGVGSFSGLEARSVTLGAADSGDDEDEGYEVLIGVGLLFGLNENTPDTTLKWTGEVDF